MLDHEDADWLAENGGQITGFESDISGASLLCPAALRGLTEIMTRIGKSAKPNNGIQPLHTACKRELPNLEMLEVIVDICGVDVNSHAMTETNNSRGLTNLVEGPTALHLLAEAKFWWQVDGVKLLVKNGADANSRNEKGETPLHIASVGNSIGKSMGDNGKELGFWKPNCVQLLLQLGADPNALDDVGMSPLNKAASAPEIMRMLLQGGADISAGKMSALFSTILSSNVESVRILLDAGVSPNSEDSDRCCRLWDWDIIQDQARTTLFCAAFSSSGEIIKLLIERGADVFAPLNDRETLIHFVFEYAEYRTINAFLECSGKIDFSVRDKLGRTVLLAACNWTKLLPGYRQNGWVPKVSGPVIRLLDCGADISAVDSEGQHALHHLLNNGEIEEDTILQFLERKPCQILTLQKDNRGFSPLHCALRTLRPGICEALVTLGGNLMEPDPSGITTLHHIASQALQLYRSKYSRWGSRQEHPADYFEGCLRLWQKYLDLGGDINVRDAQGSPPLFAYLSSPQRELRSWLRVEKEALCHVYNFKAFFEKADVRARNAEAETALHVVARREKNSNTKEGLDRRLFEFLMANGLDPLVEDGAGSSALDAATACRKGEILALFQFGT
jgi:ankyrin repeat protein